MKFDYSDESHRALLSCGAVYYAVQKSSLNVLSILVAVFVPCFAGRSGCHQLKPLSFRCLLNTKSMQTKYVYDSHCVDEIELYSLFTGAVHIDSIRPCWKCCVSAQSPFEK